MGIEEQEFQILLNAKNHKELVKRLDDILKAMGKDKEIDTSGIEAVISKLQLAGELEKTTTAINAMVTVIAQKLEERKQEDRQWTFKVERDSDGFIDVVRATNN
jgi:Asp-tRNA(Asn)/Glu-tRNA(Gln) amidotransferase C subunit